MTTYWVQCLNCHWDILPELRWILLRVSGWWTDWRKGGCTIRWLTCSLSETLTSWRTLTWEEQGGEWGGIPDSSLSEWGNGQVGQASPNDGRVHSPLSWTHCWCNAHWALNTWSGTSESQGKWGASCGNGGGAVPAHNGSWTPHLYRETTATDRR